MDLETGISRCVELARAYGRAGKHRIAARVLAEVRARLVETTRSRRAAGRHAPGPRSSRGGELAAALAQAERDVAELARAVAPRPQSADARPAIVLFGLSADPPTGRGGHAGIVAWCARELRLLVPNDERPELAREEVPVQQVWVMPVYRHMYPDKRELTPFVHRVAMARLAFERLPGLEGRVRVVETERDLWERAAAGAMDGGGPCAAARLSTADIVRSLVAGHPDRQFALVLGGDTYADLRAGKWKDAEALRALVPVVAVPRAGVRVAGTEERPPRLDDVSSTRVRRSTDLAFLQSALAPEVLGYVQRHGLYAIGRLRRPP